MWMVTVFFAAVVAAVACEGPIATAAGPDDAPAQPPYYPGAPPHLRPLDAGDDLFRTDFLADPDAHFTFSARTARLHIAPLVLETHGNINAFLARRTSSENRFASSEEIITSTSTDGAPARPPFVFNRQDGVVRPTSVQQKSLAPPPSILNHNRVVRPTSVQQKSLAPPPSILDHNRVVRPTSMQQRSLTSPPSVLDQNRVVHPMFVQQKTLAGDKIIDVESFDGKPIEVSQLSIEASIPYKNNDLIDEDRGTLEQHHVMPNRPDETFDVKTNLIKLNSSRSNVIQPISLETKIIEDKAVTERPPPPAPPVAHRRKPIHRMKVNFVGESGDATAGGRQQEMEAGARHVTVPPPPPVPTLSPWIDGYGK